MKYLTILGVALAIYVFYLMISSIDFSGMGFADIKLIISICIGIAVCFISLNAGIHIMVSALNGFVTGAIIYALILWFIEYVF
ncbi:hypothetical protein ACFLU4_05560 [Chloroflexota bacterium]